jgi:hypothetical protein
MEHVNAVFDESMNSDFLMVFHDDDNLQHDFIENIIKLV